MTVQPTWEGASSFGSGVAPDATVLAAAVAQADRWQFELTPYVWIPGLDGHATVRCMDSSGDLSVGDVLDMVDSLDGAFTGHFEAGDTFVLYTDGVSDRFTSQDYPGVLHHAPETVARNIVQRFGKDHDDAACIAVRYCP